MRIRLTSPAEAELSAALEWYGEIRAGLAASLLDDYEAVLVRLRENPRQFPKVQGLVRRAQFNRFPYALFFRIHPDEVEVIACFHGRRNPREWRRRI